MHSSEPLERTCPNCGHRAEGRFCPECGQEHGPLFPTVGQWVNETLAELVGVEGKLFSSLRALVWPPGALTMAWYQGRRASFVSPLRLYLAAALLFFLAWPETPLPAALRAFVAGFSAGSGTTGVTATDIEVGSRVVLDSLPGLLVIAFVPLFGWLLRVFVRGPGGFVGHLVTALHFHVVFFVIMSLTTLPTFVFGRAWQATGLPALLLILFAFLTASIARAYRQRWWRALAGTFAASLLYALAAAGAIGYLLSIVMA